MLGNLIHELSVRLGNFFELNNLGEMAAGDAGIYLERDPDTVRGPDLQFVSSKRCPAKSEWNVYLDISPDLCIEIVSSNDNWPELEEKVDRYFSVGVKLVWIVDPKTREVRVRRLDGRESVIPLTGTLSGENIVPGFELKLSDLFGESKTQK